MIIIAAYVLTALAVFFGVTSLISSGLGALGFRLGGGLAWQLGALSGGIITWAIVSRLWAEFVEGYHALPLAAVGVALLMYMWQYKDWKRLGMPAKVTLGGETWALILFTAYMAIDSPVVLY